MDEYEFAKKIVSLLDEKPLDQTIESRLAHARAQALLRHQVNEEVTGLDNVLALKIRAGNGWSWIKWGVLSAVAGAFLLIHNPLNNWFTPEQERVSLMTPDYQNFVQSYQNEQQKFQEWDAKLDDSLK
jgi:hypothetical protein